MLIQQLALMEATGKPFAQLARDTVLAPLGMTNSSYEQPLPAAYAGKAARAHDPMGARGAAPWHVYPEQAAAGLWTTASNLAKFAIEVQLATQGRSERVLSASFAREMVSPVGVRPVHRGVRRVQAGGGLVTRSWRQQLGVPV